MIAGTHWLSGGGYVAATVLAQPNRLRGTWSVTLDCLHVCLGTRFRVLRAEAIFDDFGDLVIVADNNGKVVLQ